MSTNSVSALPTALAGLLRQYANPAQSGSEAGHGGAASQAAAAPLSLGRDEAYSLSLGSAASSKAMLGYSRLATLGARVDSDLLAATDQADSASNGSVAVEVHALAGSQTLVSSLFGDPDTVSLGTGSLTVSMGTLDDGTGALVPKGEAVEISITDGSLNGIAKAINESRSGLEARVVETGGGFELQIRAKETGASTAFSLGGLAELEFDPAKPQLSPLTQTAESTDASYSADGTEFTWPANTGVPVAFGTTAQFTTTGSLSVAKAGTADSIKSMVTAFNSLQRGIIELTADKGELAANANLAAGLFKRVGDAATAGYSTGGAFSSLADLGIAVEKDGTLSVDQSALAAAMGKDPASAQSVAAQAAKAMDEAIRPYLGSRGAISSQVSVLGSLIGRGASLLDYLGNAQNQGGGMFGKATSLLSALA